jgi:hypothetical protein
MLELSPRQTGKSTRLLEAVKKWLDEDKNHNAIVISANLQSSKTLQKQFELLFNINLKSLDSVVYENDEIKIIKKEKIKRLEFISNTEFSNNENHIKFAFFLSEYHKLFYDEFDLYINNIILNKEYYYSSTPLKLRELSNENMKNDKLLNLIKIHNWKIIKYNKDYTLDSLRQLKFILSDEQYQTEVLGNYLK